ncbi:MAG TPA: hypothetical protein ENK44_16680 [Caldithrix abyssi]|uniref:SRPBCC family protein n=1 Tax=Caldithrix abyssi TaxID=187145 RepID=A0A7V4WXA5_CALAY|nr:hypothetical protein [Caldithrix abyssi]
MTFFKISGIIFTVVFCALLVVGLLTESESVVSADVAIEAPQPVVLRILTDSSTYTLWNPFTRKSIYKGSDVWETTYQIDEKQFVLREKIQIDYNENCVCRSALDSLKNTYLFDVKQKYSVRSLPDGSSEVNLKMSYRTYSISVRLLNYLFLKSRAARIALENVQALKTYIQG